MKIRAIQTYLYRGRVIEAGAELSVPAEVDYRTANAWLQAALAVEVKQRVKTGPSKKMVKAGPQKKEEK